jgi:hypothetical protein
MHFMTALPSDTELPGPIEHAFGWAPNQSDYGSEELSAATGIGIRFFVCPFRSLVTISSELHKTISEIWQIEYSH